jgi:hypothetical protein
MKAYWGSRGVAEPLIWALGGSEGSASRPGRFTHQERTPAPLNIRMGEPDSMDVSEQSLATDGNRTAIR